MKKVHLLSALMVIMLAANALAQDKIIKKDGLIIHADVVEVGFEVVKYKKSTYPDGPVFSIYRDEIYAIAYQDNTTDYFSLNGMEGLAKNKKTEDLRARQQAFKNDPQNDTSGVRHGKTLILGSGFPESIAVSVGLGIVNTYSQAEEGLGNLDREFSLPAIHLRLWAGLDEKLRLGTQLSLITFNYRGDQINEYDEIISLSDVEENVLSLGGFARYEFGRNLVRPYALIGLGFTRSNIKTQRDLAFADEGPVFRINSFAQTVNLSVLLRGGVTVALADAVSVYADVGTGISLFQVGGQFVFTLNQPL